MRPAWLFFCQILYRGADFLQQNVKILQNLFEILIICGTMVCNQSDFRGAFLHGPLKK